MMQAPLKNLFACALTFLFGQVAGMVHLTPEMVQANSLEEYLAASKQPSLDETLKMRERLLEESDLVDSQMILADSFDDQPGFYHGVASGDPLPDAIVLWTRYTPASKLDVINLELRMAAVDPELELNAHLDPTLNPNLRRARIQVTSDFDFTAKIDVTGLPSSTNFVYVFTDGRNLSPIGQTKTAPGPNDNVEQLVYAVFSCANWPNGYFHPYDVASIIKDIDFWYHVGDYTYEYGTYSSYASDSPERKSILLPEWEEISLQDYRSRMAIYHLDEGLQNLRRRAPLAAIWDDHELTNNAYGDGSDDNTGAENHQPVCPVNYTATDGEKEDAECDRDEGDATVRFTNAARAYLEWMPLRPSPDPMGVVQIGSITQVIEWGSLATIIGFDTRISHRSMDPTLRGPNWEPFFPFALNYTDVSEYSDPSSEAYAEMQKVASYVASQHVDPSYTLIGDSMELLREAFSNSKAAGKPWQIWATATALGRAVKGDVSTLPDNLGITDENIIAQVKNITDGLLSSNDAVFFRALIATSLTATPWNNDDYSGFAIEQRKIIAMLKEVANNAIILAGDLHDAYAWTLYEDGALDGNPVAVNLVGHGVTSPGWGPIMNSTFNWLQLFGFSSNDVYDITEKLDENANPGLKYFNHQYKGFFAVKVTKDAHIAEFIGIPPDTILTDYETARSFNNDGLTGGFLCDAQLTTTAGSPGSLDRSDNCSAIEYETARPAVWDIPVGNLDAPLTGDVMHFCGYFPCQLAYDAESSGVPSPVAAPVGAPVAVPVAIPVAVPVAVPVAAPVTEPVASKPTPALKKMMKMGMKI